MRCCDDDSTIPKTRPSADIDELNGKIDQLRDQNRRLDAEAERLAEMVRLSPAALPSEH